LGKGRYSAVGPRELACYPFLKEAAELVRSRGPTLEELVSDIAYSDARGAGVERARAALGEAAIPAPFCRSELECLNEMLAYICARFVVSVAGSAALVRRYALAEAKRAGKLLEQEPLETQLAVSEELGIAVRQEDGVLSIHFPLFLKYTAQLRAAEWKLINRRVMKGMVELGRAELCRVAEEAVKRRFESELPLAVPDSVKEAFKEPAAALRNEADALLRRFQPKDLGKIRVDCFPPCIRHLLAMAQSGENVPHSGRFALVAFLHSLGVSEEEIMKAFAASPDFKEDKTRYQVEHITGVTSGTEYSAPGCDTMKTYSLCIEPDSLCAREWMTHPMKYYRVKMRPRKGAGSGQRTAGWGGTTEATGNRQQTAGSEQGSGEKKQASGTNGEH